jgi:hypothetical protein
LGQRPVYRPPRRADTPTGWQAGRTAKRKRKPLYDLFTRELGDDEVGEIKMTENINFDEHEKLAIPPTGLFPFKIILKNELQGKRDVMFAGKPKVSTYTPDQNVPDFKGKKEYYVDHDWMLPIGYLWLNPQERRGAQPFSLLVTM